MSTTATSAPPQPLSESGHGVMLAPYREILVDAVEPGDLPERQVSRRVSAKRGFAAGVDEVRVGLQ